MSNSDTASIRPALPDDAPRLAELQAAYLLGDGGQGKADSPAGFLVSGYDADSYRHFADVADHFYVGEEDGRVIAFVLAMSSERIPEATPSHQVNHWLLEQHPQPFTLISQICVAPEAASGGWGRELYNVVRQLAAGRPQFAAIVLDPPNGPSVRFHERVGFHKAFETVGHDGRPRGIWGRDLAGPPQS
ncbi:GNAT family N-acetyltransferase [Aquisalimonas sp.]|uniref:GNAT family N-acetyltransferase n=1 Tax=unclassified Aquisalimonas TaxID=2644645 RepID=UPI0025B91298|nr:GNAT family N-acetyltransferase [Aquisalimonas sp.]